MPQSISSFYLDDLPRFQQKALAWGSQFTHCVFLNDNDLYYPHHGFRKLLAVGSVENLVVPDGKPSFSALQDFHDKQPSWLFGYLSYDLKNELEALVSHNPTHIQVPTIAFFRPQYVLEFYTDHVVIHESAIASKALMEQIEAFPIAKPSPSFKLAVEQKVSRAAYLEKVRAIQEHILEGDVYELNYCMEFFAENASIDPLSFFLRLNLLSPMPFASFLKIQDLSVECASPERFLKKVGKTLITQPVKGTTKRGKSTLLDLTLKERLFSSEKERAENMMIVDLARNDLAKSAETGSVHVEELYQVIGFKQVYQMLSTVSATLKSTMPFSQAIAHVFPMGSMTGAPKIRAMELIEDMEATQRGLYSGAIGYITPNADFDFNVVIRSLLYDKARRCLSFEVGSAITSDAQPEQEYEECLLKAQALLNVLGNKA